MIEYKNFIIIENDIDFEVMTKENFNKRISNGFNVWKFEKSNGFNNVEDVKNYLQNYFIR